MSGGRIVFSDRQLDFRGAVRWFLRESRFCRPVGSRCAQRPWHQFWRDAGRLGILGIGVPESLGGLADSDFRHSVIVTEEIQALGLDLAGLRIQADMCLPLLLNHGSPDQRAHWLPRLASGRSTMALGLSEPATGCTVSAMSTTARRCGDRYIVNGRKTFVPNGDPADAVIVAVRTGHRGSTGASLLIVDADTPGFAYHDAHGRASALGEHMGAMSFTDMEVPVSSILGVEGQALGYLAANLAQERLSAAVKCQAAAAAVVSWTVDLHRDVGLGPNAQRVLARCDADIAAGQGLVDEALRRHVNTEFTAVEAARLKKSSADLQSRVISCCVRLCDPSIGLSGWHRPQRTPGRSRAVRRADLQKSPTSPPNVGVLPADRRCFGVSNTGPG